MRALTLVNNGRTLDVAFLCARGITNEKKWILAAGLFLPSLGSAAHWVADHVTIDYHSEARSPVLQSYANAPQVTNSHTVAYDGGCFANAYSGLSYDAASVSRMMTVSFYVNYVKDSKSDPDAPDTAAGTGPITEDVTAGHVVYADASASVTNNTSGIAKALIKGSFVGLAGGYSYSVTQDGLGVSYPSPATVALSATQVFSFHRNTGTESGSHVATISVAAPVVQTEADVYLFNPLDAASAVASLEFDGAIALDVSTIH